MKYLTIDLETTGVDIATAEVVQYALVISNSVGDQSPGTDVSYARPVNGSIPAEATAIHGITDDMVTGCMPFGDVVRYIQTCHIDYADVIVTFNGAAFDLPILARYGITWNYAKQRHLDVYRVWQVARERHLINERSGIGAHRFNGSLGAAYAWATGIDPSADYIEHDALADCGMTLAVAQEFVCLFGLDACLQWTAEPLPGFADYESKIAKADDGTLSLAFGKHKGTPLSRVDAGYLQWMLSGDFHPHTKQVIRDYMRAT